ncbi:hypothetical protein TIFTF001_013732 [Ficus carica]|uniref:Uncharacterized protein n=1 Tax=Ficus carica TaxID=3494 RepID=A0AA88AET9_FICCA|nr:hypothetical protein TIFTF001_013732 [Ficus carica]
MEKASALFPHSRKVGVRGLLRFAQLASSWRRGNVPLEVSRATSESRTPEQPVVPKGGSVLQVLFRHRIDLDRLSFLDRERLFWWFSAIGVVAGSYGALERVSSTGHFLWVRNGERNVTLVMVVVIVPCFKCATVNEVT